MKTKLMILGLAVLLAGCMPQDEMATENKLENQLEKSAESFITEEKVETETEFGTVEEVVIQLKDEIDLEDEVEMRNFKDTLVEYGPVATQNEAFNRYLMVMAVLMEDYPTLLSTDDWQNLQEQWQELNDPID